MPKRPEAEAAAGPHVGALTRRSFLAGSAIALSGCVAEIGAPLAGLRSEPDFDYAEIYGPRPNERFPIPAVDLSRIAPPYRRQKVPFTTGEPPGTIIVDPRLRFLYFVEPGNTATRYGVGVGRAGMEWSGTAEIGRKQAWPTWTPTADMIERDPRNAEWADGMEPGLNNPLGARALYIYQDGVDTLYRLHGSPEVDSIGRAVSSGCIRLLNQDVIDLYNRAEVGATVIVRPTVRESVTDLVAG